MTDPLINDVKELMDKQKGDARILKQIYRACENDEVISNYERSYVQKLVDEHLDRKPKTEPDTPEITTSVEPAIADENEILAGNEQTVLHELPLTTKPARKNKKLFAVIGVVVFAALLSVSVASLSGPQDEIPDVQPVPPTAPPATTSLETDLPSYREGDIISISGSFPTMGSVALSITDPAGQPVWSEQLQTKSDGWYSTLVIAGGPGWERPGLFTVTAESDSEFMSSEFTFGS